MKRIIMISLLCLLGCRTIKTSEKVNEEMKRNVALEALGLKAAVKETNVLRYWPDGSVYQFEQMRERVDEAEMARLRTEEKLVAARTEVQKERAPGGFWVYVLIALVSVGLVLLAAIWVYRLFKN